MDAFAEKYTGTHEGRCFDIPMLAMYCVAMGKSVVDQVGVLDERYERGMFEDDDFALRVRDAGYRIVCAEDVFVHHWGRASFGALEQAEYDRIFQANKARFEEKWRRPWVAHTYRSSSKSSVKREIPRLFDPYRITWQCNICGAQREGLIEDLRPEVISCPSCRSTVRMRGLVRVLSLELFGKNLMLADFPENKKLRGMGLSDWLGYAEALAQKLDYTNTFFDQEPRFDITEVDPAMAGTLDFLVSSDVFEHIAPPVSRAFDNAYKLLKPGGVLVLTVPYSLRAATDEHFPDLHDYEEAEEGGEKILKNVTRDGREQVFRDLVYHGGAGATLEMRVFCKDGLLRELDLAGFTQVRIHDTPFMDHGIYWYYPKSLPLSARKPVAKDGAS
jgi:SAM-dependent methyltransferase